MWIVDCLCLSRIFTMFGVPAPIRAFLVIRLATYTVMIVSYGAAQGLLAYFFKKAKKVTFFKTSSLLLMTILLDLYATATIAFAGSLFSDLLINGIPLKR